MKTSRRLLTNLLILLLLAPTPPTFANPVGESLVAGQATFDRSRPGQLIINQGSHRAIINWADFSIGRGELTSFVMPSSSASVLNRVVGVNPSQLFGTLQGNGHVYIINPNGVLIGRGGMVNTHSLTASTLDVSDTAYLAGAGLRFSGPSTATVKNDGEIRALGGDIFLIGHRIENSGRLEARHGKVGLAAGSEILLQPAGDNRLSVVAGNSRAPNRGQGVNNAGTIEAVSAELKAAGGNIYSLAINNGGVIRATGFRHENGRVVLVTDGGGIENSGSISAQNANGSGGSVTVSAGHSTATPGTVIHSGTITARGEAVGTQGGDVQLLGDHVGVGGQGVVDVSGRAGGGNALIGGDAHGANRRVQNAERTFIGAEAQIRADALDHGDGGRVIVWADGVTRFFGSISARGGAHGGDGGFAEVSGKQSLLYAGTADLRAPLGLIGDLLLDPKNITVSDTGDPFVPGDYDFSDNPGTAVTIRNSGANSLVSALDLADVTLQANNDIRITHEVDASANANDHGLTLQAGRQILIEADVNLRGSFTAVANHAGADLAQRDAGTASFTMGSGVSIDTSYNGPHTISISYDNGVAGAPANMSGIDNMVIGALNSGGGGITLNSANANEFDRVLDLQGAVVSFGGNINLTGGRLNLDGSLNSGSGLITVTAVNGRNLVLGADGGIGALSIDDGDLSRVTSSGGLKLVTTLDALLAPGSVTVCSATGPALVIDSLGSVTFDDGPSSFASLDASAGNGVINLAVNITTAGAQTYHDPISLAADVTLAGTDLTLAPLMGNQHDLTLNGSAMTTLAGLVTGVRNFTTGGGGVTTMSGGGLTTSGDQTYNNSLDLSSDTVLAGANLTLTAVNGNNHDLTLTFSGGTRIDGLDLIGIKDLTSGGGGLTLLSGGTITTSGSQSYLNAVELLSSMTLQGTDLALGTVAGSGFSLTLSGSGATTLNGAISGVLDLTSGGGGTTAINGGAITTLGSQQYDDPVRLGADATLTGAGVVFNGTLDWAVGTRHSRVANAAGLTAFQGPVGVSDRLSALTTDAAGSTVLSGSVLLNGASTTFNDQVLLTADTTIDEAGSGNVAFNNTVDSVNGNNFALTVNTPGGGETIFNGTIGANSLGIFSDPLGLGALTTDAAGITRINAGNVRTTGNQNFQDAVTLGADATLAGADVSFQSALDSAAGTHRSLTVNGSGVTRFNGAVGATDRLALLTTDAPGRTEIASAINLNGPSATFNDALLLTGNATVDQAGAGDVIFNGTLDSSVGHNFTLAVNTGGGGATVFNGTVGNDALGALSDDNGLGGLTTDAAGVTRLNGGNLRTTGNQTYNDAVILGADTTLAGIDISFLGTLDSAMTTMRALTVNASGTTLFNGAVGATDRLSLLTTDAAGRTEIASAINLNGPSATFNDSLLLTGNATLDQAGPGDFIFNGTVDSSMGHNFTLAVNTSGGGATVFNGTVGNDALAALSDDNGLGALTTDAAGVTRLNGGNLRTTGNQTYNDAVILGADTTLAGTDISFLGALDSALTTLWALTVNAAGVTRFNGIVGGTDRLSALTTDAAGRTEIGGASVNGNGSSGITFNDRVLLTANTAVNQAGAGSVTFNHSVDSADAGNFTLAVNTPAGADTVFNGAVGSDALGALSSNSGLGGLTTDAAGVTRLNAVSVRTTTDQTFNDPVTLGTDTTLMGDDVLFSQTLDSAAGQLHSLTVNAGGVTTFNAPIGATDRLASLTTDAAGRTELSAGTLNLNGTVNTAFNDPVLLNANLTLNQAGAGNVSFASLDSRNGMNFGLTINTPGGGDTVFNGAVGDDALDLLSDDGGLGSLTTDGVGQTRVNGAVVRTTGHQDYAERVTLGADVLLEADSVVLNQVTGAGNDLTVTADDVALTAGQAINVARLTLQPRSVRDIGLGFGQRAWLSISQAELDNVTAAVLQIGSLTAGTIFLGGISLDPTKVPTLRLVASSGIIANHGDALTVNNLAFQSAGDVTLSGPNHIHSVAGVTTMNGRSVTICDLDDLAVTTVDGLIGIRTGDGTPAANGNVTLIADNMTIGQRIDAGSGRVELQAKTAGRAINLGTETVGSLSLAAAELAQIEAGVLKIGNNAAGAITISDGLDFGVNASSPSVRTLSLESAQPISETSDGWIQVKNLGLRSVSPSGAVLDNAMNNWLRLGADVPNGSLVIRETGGYADASAAPNDIDGLTGVSRSGLDISAAALHGIAAATYTDVTLFWPSPDYLDFAAPVPRPASFEEQRLIWTSYQHLPPPSPDPVRQIRKIEEQTSWTTLSVSGSTSGPRSP